MTGYGFTGPMTARGTVFDAKAAGAAAATRRGKSARGRARVRGRRLWWLIVLTYGWV
jgi:hypothetical protein